MISISLLKLLKLKSVYLARRRRLNRPVRREFLLPAGLGAVQPVVKDPRQRLSGAKSRFRK